MQKQERGSVQMRSMIIIQKGDTLVFAPEMESMVGEGSQTWYNTARKRYGTNCTVLSVVASTPVERGQVKVLFEDGEKLTASVIHFIAVSPRRVSERATASCDEPPVFFDPAEPLNQPPVFE